MSDMFSCQANPTEIGKLNGFLFDGFCVLEIGFEPSSLGTHGLHLLSIGNPRKKVEGAKTRCQTLGKNFMRLCIVPLTVLEYIFF